MRRRGVWKSLQYVVSIIVIGHVMVACGSGSTAPSTKSPSILVATLVQNPQNTSGMAPGHVAAYDSITGKLRWSDAATIGEYGDLRTTATTAYLATGPTIQAFDSNTGKQMWRYQAPAASTYFRGFDAVTRTTLYATFITNPATGPNAEYLAAFDAATGSERWSLHTGSDVRLVATEQIAYFIQGGAGSDVTNTSLPPALRAVSATGNGTPLWTDTNFSGAGNLLRGPDGTLYLNTDTTVVAIDATTGATKWTFTNPMHSANSYSGSLALAGSTLVVSFDGQVIMGVQTTDGKQVWQQMYATAQDSATDGFVCQPVAQAPLQYNANNASSVALKVYDVASGRLDWTLKDKLPHLDETADLACDDTSVYVTNTIGVSALRLSDGATLWQDPTYSTVLRSLTTPWNGLVLVNTVSGVVALDAHTGAERWQISLAETLGILSVEGEGITQS